MADVVTFEICTPKMDHSREGSVDNEKSFVLFGELDLTDEQSRSQIVSSNNSSLFGADEFFTGSDDPSQHGVFTLDYVNRATESDLYNDLNERTTTADSRVSILNTPNIAKMDLSCSPDSNYSDFNFLSFEPSVPSPTDNIHVSRREFSNMNGESSG